MQCMNVQFKKIYMTCKKRQCKIAWQYLNIYVTKYTFKNILMLKIKKGSRMDRVRNEEVRRRAGRERELSSRADQRVLRWFGPVERMDEYRMARRVLMADVSGGGVRGRPRLGWMDGVQVALGNGRMTVEMTVERSETVESCSTYVTE